MSIRSSFVARTHDDFLSAITAASSKQPKKTSGNKHLSFVFTGQGAQWYAMGRELLHTQSRYAESI